MAYEVVVLLSALSRVGFADASSALMRAARDCDAVLEPAGAEAESAGDGEYYVARVEGRDAAERLLSRIRALEGVEAAYVKPPGALPGAG